MDGVAPGDRARRPVKVNVGRVANVVGAGGGGAVRRPVKVSFGSVATSVGAGGGGGVRRPVKVSFGRVAVAGWAEASTAKTAKAAIVRKARRHILMDEPYRAWPNPQTKTPRLCGPERCNGDMH
jgi:hypothetical protein